MIHSAKYFTYNNRSLSEFADMRIGTLDSDMYAVNIISNRNIIEQKIPGRKSPYLYNLDDEPLTIEMTVALERPKAISELRPFFRWLFNNLEYQELWFDVDPDKIYYAIFVGSPVMTYVDRSTSTDINANNRKLIGYITLTARCNAGTAFGPAVSVVRNTSNVSPYVNLYNNGDDKVFSTLRIGIPGDRLSTGGEGGNAVLRSTADNLRESYVSSGNTLYRRNRSLITDVSKNWGRFYSRSVIELVNNNITPSQTQLRAIDKNYEEFLYTVSPLTNMWETTSQADNYTYTIRELQSIPTVASTVVEATALTLKDNTKSWTTDQWLGYAVKLTSGNGQGRVRKILSNTNNTLTIGINSGSGPSDTWGVAVLPGDRYEIYNFTDENLDSGTPDALAHTTVLFDKDRRFEPNAYASTHILVVVNGTGATERDSENPNQRKTRIITANTRNTITVSTPFEFIPDDTTVFEIRPLANTTVTTYNTPFKVVLKNTTNNDEVAFDGVDPLDAIEIDMSTRRITNLRTTNIYEKWNRGYLSLETGANTIETRIYQTNPDGTYTEARGAVLVTTYTYQPIRYI